MARRETVEREVQCQCGASGTVVWDENETPPHHGGRFDERYRTIPAAFKAKENALFCGACDEKVFNFESA